jgi:uncharacterized protein involved in exopolysaccharide biosynthesis
MAIARYINTFFRHWPIYLLVSLVMAGLFVAFSFTLKQTYTTSSTIWVSQSAFADESVKRGMTDGSFWDSPASLKAGVFGEQIRIRTFVRNVIARTSFKSVIGDPVKEGELISDIMDNSSAISNGYNSFSIVYSNATANRSYEITRALVEQFLFEQREEIKRSGESSIALLKGQVASAQKAMESADNELKDMLIRYPCSATGNLNERVLTQEDLECQVLLQKITNTRSSYNDLVKRLQETELAYNAAIEGKADYALRVVDQPETYENGKTNRLVSVAFGAGGFFVGVILSALVVVFLTLTDNTIRLRAVGAKMFDSVKVFELPRIKTPRPRRVRGGQIIAVPDVKQRMIAQLRWAQDESANELKEGSR